MTTDHRPAPPSARVHGLGTALVACVATGAVLEVAAVWGAGPAAGRSVALAVLLTVGFFAFGALGSSLAAAYAPATALFVAMLTYLLEVLALGLVLVVVARSGLVPDTLDADWLGGSVIVLTLVWTAALLARTVRGDRRSPR